jgi:hypothetical protein
MFYLFLFLKEMENFKSEAVETTTNNEDTLNQYQFVSNFFILIIKFLEKITALFHPFSFHRLIFYLFLLFN